MPNLHMLLCHPSDSVVDQMRQTVLRADARAHCTRAIDLTEAYHHLEHAQPACLIISNALVSKPEFELLAALLKQLHIGCIVWTDQPQTIMRESSSGFAYYAPNSPDDDFKSRLQQALLFTHPEKVEPVGMSKPVLHDPHRVNLIGASTGGVDALTRVLRHFSENSPPTLIVQHTGGKFATSLIRLLDRATSAQVVPAQDGQRLQTGHVYLAPDDTVHLRLSQTSRSAITLSQMPAVSGHRPSIDMLFQSAVSRGRHVVAALLTGMGKDGAEGLLALRNAGAHTIAQDKATCVVYGMPRVAAQLGAASEQLPIDRIGPKLVGAMQSQAIA